MYYYCFNIPHYRMDTAHLSPIEHYIYRTLLDTLYLDERGIKNNINTITRKLKLDDSTDVERVLNEFLTLVDERWINKRVEREIAHFRLRIKQKSEAGRASAEQRKYRKNKKLGNRRSTGVQRKSTTVQRIKNQESIINNKDINTQYIMSLDLTLPSWMPEQTFMSFIRHRHDINKSLTKLGAKLLITKLTKIREDGFDPVECINTAIESCWTTVWPPSQRAGKTGSAGNKKALEKWSKT